jgi:hypothetical protein
VYSTRNLNDADGLKFPAACAPDLLISAYFNQRLHAPALALPKRGCLNIHLALQPEASDSSHSCIAARPASFNTKSPRSPVARDG